MGNVSCMESLTLQDSAEKALSQLRINEGVNLFIEDCRCAFPDASNLAYMHNVEHKCKWEIVIKWKICDDFDRNLNWIKIGIH